MHIKFHGNQMFDYLQVFGKEAGEIDSIVFDSRKSQDGSVFFCMKGFNENGETFIEEAISKGTTVVVSENGKRMKDLSKQYPNLTFIEVWNTRTAAAQFSAAFYENSYRSLFLMGVTGTNGKTTVASYIRSIFNALGKPTGMIGTNGIWSSKEKLPFRGSTPTTPEAPDLHRIFSEYVKQGEEAAVMEVSSIALDQKRVEGLQFNVAVHTNLSPEHMEYHKTFENYREAKLELFKQTDKAVVNVDDVLGTEILSVCPGKVLTYSLDRETAADIHAYALTPSDTGTSAVIEMDGKAHNVFLPVFGEYNAANVLAAICTALHAGYSLSRVLEAAEKIEPVEGRFQIVWGKQKQKIIIDYAHTPTAMDQLLKEAKKQNNGRRIILMLMGIGIRDFSKMPRMAETAEGRADHIVVSVDHPGDHEPQVIIEKVLSGFKHPDDPSIHTAPNRKEAVRKALSLSEEEDIVLLTSGCINGGQIVKGKSIPHSDERVIEEYFAENGCDQQQSI